MYGKPLETSFTTHRWSAVASRRMTSSPCALSTLQRTPTLPFLTSGVAGPVPFAKSEGTSPQYSAANWPVSLARFANARYRGSKRLSCSVSVGSRGRFRKGNKGKSKSSMTPRVLPWRDFNEWRAVYKGLFSNDPTWAIHRVRLWHLRGNVAHAIECTAQLIAARDSTDVFRERLELSMIVVRAVNGLVDPGQRKRAKPISMLAEGIGLPVWLVDVRHQATHNSLPSIEILRTACATLLDYFKRTYWDVQAQVQEDITWAGAMACWPSQRLHATRLLMLLTTSFGTTPSPPLHELEARLAKRVKVHSALWREETS